MNAFVDIHHHLLYGLDDGPAKREEMFKMLDAARRQGVRTIIATPHVSPGINPFSPEAVYRRTAEAQAYCDEAGYGMRILPGAEMMYTFQAERYLAQQRIPTLGGSNRLLMEFSLDIRYEDVERAVQTVLRCGLVPILAHIERYPCLMRGRRAERLRTEYDVLYQINCGFLLDGGGFFPNRTIRRLLEAEKIDFIATDAHGVRRRPCRMKEAYGKLVSTVGQEYADFLTGNGCEAEDCLGA